MENLSKKSVSVLRKDLTEVKGHISFLETFISGLQKSIIYDNKMAKYRDLSSEEKTSKDKWIINNKKQLADFKKMKVDYKKEISKRK